MKDKTFIIWMVVISTIALGCAMVMPGTPKYALLFLAAIGYIFAHKVSSQKDVAKVAKPEEEYLYKGWLKVKPIYHKGKRFEKLVMYDGVIGMVLNLEGKILLVKQYRPAAGKYTLELPAGCLDKPGKDEVQVLIEELKEEADIPKQSIIGIKKMTKYLTMVGVSDVTSHMYAVTVDVPAINKKIENDDVEEIIWLTYEELKEKVTNGEIDHNATQRAYMYLREQELMHG